MVVSWTSQVNLSTLYPAAVRAASLARSLRKQQRAVGLRRRRLELAVSARPRALVARRRAYRITEGKRPWGSATGARRPPPWVSYPDCAG